MKKKRYSYAEKILLLFADVNDFIISSSRSADVYPYLLGAPYTRKNRLWLERVFQDSRRRAQLKKTISAMKKKRWIAEKVSKNKQAYFLTEKGKEKFLQITARAKKKKRLPGEWIMVFYDIPEQMRKKRDQLRIYLKILGFEQLQRSIWVSRYQVEKEILEYITFLGMQEDIHVLRVQKIPMTKKR